MAFFFAQSQKPSGPDTRRAFPNRSDCANNTGELVLRALRRRVVDSGRTDRFVFSRHTPIRRSFPAAQRKPETVSKSVLLVDGRCYGTMGCQGPDGAAVRDDV